MPNYVSARAFKAGLDARLKNEYGGDISPHRQRVIFNRFLVRLSLQFEKRIVLKGGFALEQRIVKARTTNDIDLSLRGSQDILGELRTAGAMVDDDFMRFEVSPHKYPHIENEGLNYEGKRFRVVCFLDEKIYGNVFSVDVVFEKVFGRIEYFSLRNFLEFAEVSTSTIQIYPLETHIAEKFHAYSVPLETGNSRIKDLPDLAFLANRAISGKILKASFEYVFRERNTHAIPRCFPAPPKSWSKGFLKIAKSNSFEWESIDELFEVVSKFINPILDSDEDLIWNPNLWEWK